MDSRPLPQQTTLTVEESLEVIAISQALQALSGNLNGNNRRVLNDRLRELVGIESYAEQHEQWAQSCRDRDARKSDLRSADQSGIAA